MNIAQLKNLSFDEFQRMAPHIIPNDRLTCSDLLEEAIRRVSDVNIHNEAEDEADAMFEEKKEDMESEHETAIEAKDDEITTLKEKIEELETAEPAPVPVPDGEEIAVFKEKLKKLAKKLKGSQGYSSKMKDERNELQGTVREQADRIEELQTQVDQAHVLGREYQNDRKLAEERLQTANGACLAIEKDRNFHLHRAQEAVASRDAARDELVPIQKQLSQRAAQVATLVKRNADLDASFKEKVLEVHSHNRKISDLTEELEVAKRGVSSANALQTQFTIICDQRDQYKARIEKIQKERDFQIKQLRDDHLSYKTAIKKENTGLFHKLEICQADLQKQKGLVVPAPDATLNERIVNLEARLNDEYEVSGKFNNQLRTALEERDAELYEVINTVANTVKKHTLSGLED